MDILGIEEKDKSVKAFIVLDKERASDKGRSTQGRLSGISLGIKSNICVDGLLTTAGSKTLEDYVAPYDASVVERIKSEGGSILGMTNMDEFACGSSGESSFFGATDNPAAPGRIPGGSSSGSAAAVAAGFVDAALGSDTGGSIRNPASHCGIVGFKPTYGVVSRYGLLDLAMSLDQIGPLARDVSCAALLLECIAGHDPKDETSLSLDKKFYSFHCNLRPELEGKRIGYAKEFDDLIEDAGIKKVMHSALDRLTSRGAEIVDVSLPNMALAIPTYYLNVYVEFFSATRKYDGRRFGRRIEEVCGEEVLRRILLGSYISQKEFSGKYYRKALQARSLIRKDMSDALKGVDVLVSPAVPKLPHKIGTKIDDIFTVPANLAGLPAGVVPAGKVDCVPTGLQVIGDVLKDQAVLDVMAGFEQA
jgi:aspartyl-tRNA(Asn)/glutamyl-tRNA(Gln) amidotransferase subunit A